MGQDRQPKHRQQERDLRRRKAVRKPYARLLIVCEGKKSECNYLEEIRQDERISTAHVKVLHSDYGTAPIQVAEYAEDLFLKGSPATDLRAREFDQVFVVFDRDEHPTYYTALDKVAALDGVHTNDEDEQVAFTAIPSVPCFELWLLLHFADVLAPLHRDEAYERLKRPHLPDYAKGNAGYWERTKERLDDALRRSDALALHNDPRGGNEPVTRMNQLVRTLLGLKGGK